jgi:peptidoglycan hydrolase-like protein with peptidoglycan-binding domain
MSGPINTQHVPTLQYGDENEAVSYMQSLLAKKGYALPKSVKKTNKYGYDGEWGDETAKVFHSFQLTHKDMFGKKLETDDECGPLSWGALLGIVCKG